MTNEEKNKPFKECLERISENFGRVDFRERLMLRMAFDAGADLKKRYEKQKEINKELVDENEELKRSLWHNLRKNPQDLPKEDGAVFVVDMDYGHPGYKVAMFWKEDGAFTGQHLAKLDVVAWREIPVFQEGA